MLGNVFKKSCHKIIMHLYFSVGTDHLIDSSELFVVIEKNKSVCCCYVSCNFFMFNCLVELLCLTVIFFVMYMIESVFSNVFINLIQNILKTINIRSGVVARVPCGLRVQFPHVMDICICTNIIF